MTREEAKKMWPIIKAFGEGKDIEFRNRPRADWVCLGNDAYFDDVEEESEFRIKPAPKYRPFTSVEECWQEMQKHQPFGWIKTKDDKRAITDVDVEGIIVTTNAFYSFDFAIKHFTFDDGTPFGVKEEEYERCA